MKLYFQSFFLYLFYFICLFSGVDFPLKTAFIVAFSTLMLGFVTQRMLVSWSNPYYWGTSDLKQNQLKSIFVFFILSLILPLLSRVDFFHSFGLSLLLCLGLFVQYRCQIPEPSKRKPRDFLSNRKRIRQTLLNLQDVTFTVIVLISVVLLFSSLEKKAFHGAFPIALLYFVFGIEVAFIIGWNFRDQIEASTQDSELEVSQERSQMNFDLGALALHDLAAPLHVLGFCSERLAELIQTDDYSKEEMKKYVERVISTSARASEMLHDMKNLLKNTKNKLPIASLHDAHRNALKFVTRRLSLEKELKAEIARDQLDTTLFIRVQSHDFFDILSRLYEASLYQSSGQEFLAEDRLIQVLEKSTTRVILLVRDYSSVEHSDDLKRAFAIDWVRQLIEAYGGIFTKQEKAFRIELPLSLDQA